MLRHRNRDVPVVRFTYRIRIAHVVDLRLNRFKVLIGRLKGAIKPIDHMIVRRIDGQGSSVIRPVLFAGCPVFVARKTKRVEVATEDKGEALQKWAVASLTRHARPRCR